MTSDYCQLNSVKTQGKIQKNVFSVILSLQCPIHFNLYNPTSVSHALSDVDVQFEFTIYLCLLQCYPTPIPTENLSPTACQIRQDLQYLQASWNIH